MPVSEFSVSEEQIEKILYLRLWVINFTANWQVENGRNLTDNWNFSFPSKDGFIFEQGTKGKSGLNFWKINQSNGLLSAAAMKIWNVSFLTSCFQSGLSNGYMHTAYLKLFNKAPNEFQVALSYVFANFKTFECPKRLQENVSTTERIKK